MNNIRNIFNNRELAVGFWFLIFLIFLLFKEDTRRSILEVVKSFFDRKLIGWHITIILYVSFMIYILIITIIHVLLAFIEHNQEYRDVEYQDVASFLNIILGILGIHILSKTIVEFVVNIKENILLNLLKDLALPSILSIMFIPYIYLYYM